MEMGFFDFTEPPSMNPVVVGFIPPWRIILSLQVCLLIVVN